MKVNNVLFCLDCDEVFIGDECPIAWDILAIR